MRGKFVRIRPMFKQRKGTGFSKVERKHITISGILVALFLLIFGLVFSAAISIAGDFGYIYPGEVQTLIADVRENGELLDNIADTTFNRGNVLRRKVFPVENQEYSIFVSNNRSCSDYFAFSTLYMGEKMDCEIVLECDVFSENSLDSGYSYLLCAYLFWNDAAIKTQENLPTGTHIANFIYEVDRSGVCDLGSETYNSDLSPEDGKYALNQAQIQAERFVASLPSVLSGAGLSGTVDEYFPSLYKLADSGSFRFAILMLITMITGALDGIALVILLSLICAHVYQKSMARYLAENPPLPRGETPPDDPLPSLQSGIDAKVAGAIKKTKLRPFIGEIAIRAVGISLLLLVTVFAILNRINGIHPFGEGATAFFQAAQPYVSAVDALAGFILTLVVINIVAESHKNLARNSVLFFALGLAYYIAVSLGLFTMQLIYQDGWIGVLMVGIFQFALPGNLAFGIGIFCFIGFFLFSDPHTHFISRRAFRSLSIIPLTLALVSLVMSALWTANITFPPYTVSNFLFIRNPFFLIVGIAYEYLIFGIRSRYRKLYGDKASEMESLPEVQMVKNLSLCGLIAFLTLIFYVLPQDIRRTLGFLSIYSFDFLAIPLFLFQKPASGNRSPKWDALYYAVFLTLLFLPSIINIVANASSN